MIGVEIGASMFTDACKAAITGLDWDIDVGVYTDMIVAGLLLPQVSQVTPRIRMELVMGATSYTYSKLQKFLEEVVNMLGEDSMAAWYVEAMRLELGEQ